MVAAADPTRRPGPGVGRAAGLLGIGAQAAAPATEAGAGRVRRLGGIPPPGGGRLTGRRRLANGRTCTGRWQRSPTPRTIPTRRPGTGRKPRPVMRMSPGSLSARPAGRGRGGLAAAASFLERAALLTPEPVGRAQRSLTAVRAKYAAGARTWHSGCWWRWRPGRLTRCGPRRWSTCAARSRCSSEEQRRAGRRSARPGGSERLDAVLARETHLEAPPCGVAAATSACPWRAGGRRGRTRRAARTAASGGCPTRRVRTAADGGIRSGGTDPGPVLEPARAGRRPRSKRPRAWLAAASASHAARNCGTPNPGTP